MRAFVVVLILAAMAMAEPPTRFRGASGKSAKNVQSPDFRPPPQAQFQQQQFASFQPQFQRQETTEPAGEAPYPAASEAPYPASGWKPEGAAFTLPERFTNSQQQQQPQFQEFEQQQGYPEASTPSNAYGPPAQPDNSYGAPAEPDNSYGPPATTTEAAQPDNSYGAPAEPDNSYGPPATTTEAAQPDNSYGPPAEPDNSYGAPAQPDNSYGAPATDAPEATTDAPQGGYSYPPPKERLALPQEQSRPQKQQVRKSQRQQQQPQQPQFFFVFPDASNNLVYAPLAAAPAGFAQQQAYVQPTPQLLANRAAANTPFLFRAAPVAAYQQSVVQF